MKPTKQTVYLPVKVEDELPDKNYSDELHSDCGLVGFENGVFGKWNNIKGIWDYPIKVKTWLKPQKAFVFTQEQLNQLLSDVIKDALNTAAEKVQTTFIEDACPLTGEEFETKIVVDRQSITNTFEETFKKFEV
jgi:hypothetical protein